jgi:class 3 adenylate cyclase
MSYMLGHPDISGFTPFAERLCSKGSIGVEMLIEHLNAYFDQLIGLVEMHGGDILKFAGDFIFIYLTSS